MTDPARVVCIDLDGVLLQHYDQPFDPLAPLKPPTPSAASFVRLLQDAGYTVVCLTARPDHSHWRIARYLESHDICVRVTNIKPPAVAYIDDRGVPFSGSWHQLMSSAAFNALIPLPAVTPLPVGEGQGVRDSDAGQGPSREEESASPEGSPPSISGSSSPEAGGITAFPQASAISPASARHGGRQNSEFRSQKTSNDPPSTSADDTNASAPSTEEPDRVPGPDETPAPPRRSAVAGEIVRTACYGIEVHPRG